MPTETYEDLLKERSSLQSQLEQLRAENEQLRKSFEISEANRGDDGRTYREIRRDLTSRLAQVEQERDTAREFVTRLTVEKQKVEQRFSDAIQLCKDKAAKYRSELQHYERGEEEFAQLTSYAATADVLAADLEKL